MTDSAEKPRRKSTSSAADPEPSHKLPARQKVVNRLTKRHDAMKAEEEKGYLSRDLDGKSSDAPTPHRRISKKLREVIDLLLTGSVTTQRAAADRVGMNEKHVSEQFQRQHVLEYIKVRSAKHLTAGTLRATARMLSLLDAASEHVQYKAAEYALGVAGIAPAAAPAIAINVDVKAGWIIDISDDKQPMRIVSPTPVAAPKTIEHEPIAGPGSEPEDGAR